MSTAIIFYLPHEIDFSCCICKAQFCYVCGKIWKNCNCPLFQYDYYEEPREDAGYHPPRYRHRTIFRAEKAIERYAKHLRQTRGRPDPRSLEEQIQEVREAVENGCDHGFWHQVQMTGEEQGHCKLCKSVGHKFIFRCNFCPLTSCLACHTDALLEYRREEEQQQQT